MAAPKEKDAPMNVGRIVRVVGPVMDVEFPADTIPAIYNALKVDVETPIGRVNLIAEVQQHLRRQPGARGRDVLDRRPAARHGRRRHRRGHPDAGGSLDPRPHPQRHRRAGRRQGRARRRGVLPDPPRGPGLRGARAHHRDLRDRHQGHRPARALHQGRQDRPVRRRGRRQDRRHHGAHQQPRPGARRHLRVHRRGRAHP